MKLLIDKLKSLKESNLNCKRAVLVRVYKYHHFMEVKMNSMNLKQKVECLVTSMLFSNPSYESLKAIGLIPDYHLSLRLEAMLDFFLVFQSTKSLISLTN